MINYIYPKFIVMCCLVSLGIIMLGLATHAQVSSSDVTVDVVPPNPAPQESVTVNLSSYVNNLDGVFISWLVNGRGVLSGIGQKSLTLTAPALGKQTSVVVDVSLPGGKVEQKISITPSMLVLLWQANSSYVPPFYHGKAMLPPDSEVKVVAMPEVRKPGGGMVDPKKMIYSWQKDYSNDEEGSGYGKNFYVYTSDFLDATNSVIVNATTTTGDAMTEGGIDVPTSTPKIIFYRNDPATGIHFEEALADGHKINGQEIIMAAPYFITPKELVNPLLVFNWFINDLPVPIFGPLKNSIPVKVSEGVTGTSNIRLELDHKEKVFESATKEINVQF